MHGSLRAYELQILQAGKWMIDSVFDDRGLALFEAERVEAGGRHAGVRVVEETFDQATQMTRARTIFRKVRQAPQPSAEAEAPDAAPARARRAQDEDATPGGGPRPVQAGRSESLRLVGVFGAITLGGVGVVLALRYLYEMV
ncbi:MAG TPA: hypothetical protein VGB90_09395 [Alphaproteobacteria bacterium]